jgi:hypothetical protein
MWHYGNASFAQELLLQLSRDEIEEITNKHNFPEFVKFYDIFERNPQDPTIGMDNLVAFILREPHKQKERTLKYSAVTREIASRLGYPR